MNVTLRDWEWKLTTTVLFIVVGWTIATEITSRDQRKRIDSIEQRLQAVERAAITNATLVIQQDSQGGIKWTWTNNTNAKP